mgnify:FL=1
MRGTIAHLAGFSCWPEACPNRESALRRVDTRKGVQAERRAVVSSAYCTAGTRLPPTMIPRLGLDCSQQERAHPTKRYMAGARGQPCRTPASQSMGSEIWPLTTAVAQVLESSSLAHASMPPPAPTASMMLKRKGRDTVSYALQKSRKTAAGGAVGCAAVGTACVEMGGAAMGCWCRGVLGLWVLGAVWVFAAVWLLGAVWVLEAVWVLGVVWVFGALWVLGAVGF